MSKSIFEFFKPEILEQGGGRAQLRFAVRPELTIPTGQVQGGIVGSMLDMTMALAGDGAISTASLHVDLFRPALGPHLTVAATVAQRGRRIVFAEAEMRNADGEVVARGRQTAVPID